MALENGHYRRRAAHPQRGAAYRCVSQALNARHVIEVKVIRKAGGK